jgi:phosphoglycerate kinase
MKKKTLRDVDVNGKRVLVRVDFNVPQKDGVVTDNSRVKAALPTIEYLLKENAAIILMSHLGRPKGPEDRFKLDPVAKVLSDLIGKPVEKVNTVVGAEAIEAAGKLKPGEVLLLENLRFDEREKKNDPEFAKTLASMADVYVNDAFGSSHRAHASVAGVSNYLPAVAGFLLEKEVDTLTSILDNPDRPFVAIVGGSKVSDKIGVIDALLDKVDSLLIGGGMCFTFLKANGFEIGKSILEEDRVDYCREAMNKAKVKGVNILLPTDVVVANEISAEAASKTVTISEMPGDLMGLDIGPDSISEYVSSIKKAKTIFWNGPMGVFEIDQFARGTQDVAKAVAETDAKSVIGGGDSVAALKKAHLEDQVTFVSTGGGASLELIEGKALPGVESLLDA